MFKYIDDNYEAFVNLTSALKNLLECREKIYQQNPQVVEAIDKLISATMVSLEKMVGREKKGKK